MADFNQRSNKKAVIFDIIKKILVLTAALSMFGSACRMTVAEKTPITTAANSETNLFSPANAPQVRIFTANNLLEYVERNKDEMDKMLLGQKIMVSGAVKKLDDTKIELEDAKGGKIICDGTVFFQDEWTKLNFLFTEFTGKRARQPLATVSGIYRKSVPSDESSDVHGTVYLEECKIETATK